MNGLRTIIILPLILAAVVSCAGPACGQVIDKGPQLKAKLVVALSKLVTWPAGIAPRGQVPLKIGVLGEDPFQQGDINHLDRELAGQVQAKKVVIERFATPDAYSTCHILVISRTADAQTALAKTRGQPVLTIGESPGLARQGAVINLVVVENKIKMEHNPDAAKRAGLTIAPGILRLVEIIRDP